MAAPLISIVIPTRHRPKFISVGLECLKTQEFQDFEVIVSDNYTDKNLSCFNVCAQSRIEKLRYVTPRQPMGMVDHWNFALEHAKGSYIFYLTDKMFMLPGVLSRVAEVIRRGNSEIITWLDDSYTPLSFPDYFGPGVYTRARKGLTEPDALPFSSFAELCKKGLGKKAREEQTKSEYARGKICFGGYSRALIRRVESRFGKLFHPISPDYTSMILGLSEAGRATECGFSGVVHINTDISNGGGAAGHDFKARAYLEEIGQFENSLRYGLIPGLYASINNMVAFDYVTLKNKYSLDFSFDKIVWMARAIDDINDPKRIWSSVEVEASQRSYIDQAIQKLTAAEALALSNLCEFNQTRKKVSKSNIRSAVFNFLNKHENGKQVISFLRDRFGSSCEFHDLPTAIRKMDRRYRDL